MPNSIFGAAAVANPNFFRRTVNNRSGGRVEACVSKNHTTMKNGIIAIALSVFTLLGTAGNAEARPCVGRGYGAPANTIYVSGYRYGRPVYTEKIFIGYDCYGRPRFTYRQVYAPVRNYAPPCRPAYSGYHHRHSGTSFSITFRR
jgi:hypothetical protein